MLTHARPQYSDLLPMVPEGSQQYPELTLFEQGIDLIWESVGGDMFTTCTRALAEGGRLLVIGMMSQYSDGWGASQVITAPPAHTRTSRRRQM